MVELMRADGVDVTWAEVLGYAAGGTVGRPHIAQALIRAGLVATTDRGVRAAAGWAQRYRLPKEDLDVFEARARWCGRPAGCRCSPTRGRPGAAGSCRTS